MILDHIPATTDWERAAVLAAVSRQPDAEFLADVLDLHRAMHDQGTGVDRARTTLHTRRTTIAGRKA